MVLRLQTPLAEKILMILIDQERKAMGLITKSLLKVLFQACKLS